MPELLPLGRLEQFDVRSRSFPIVGRGPRKLRGYTWSCKPRLDQGREGACVGFAIAHELAARPAPVPAADTALAKVIYRAAQRIDPWPGEDYEGTSVLAGAKVAHRLGWFDEYRWAFGVEDLAYGVGHNGPAVLGLPWYEGMRRTDSRGFVHPTGRQIGGHAILCNAVSAREETFTLHNSWGRRWGAGGKDGAGGTCRVSFDAMDKLLRNRGEAVFFIRRRSHARP
jgi:hypothetical protein